MAEIIVLKCGGSMIDDLSDQFYESIKLMKSKGIQPIIVHGGGPAINQMLDQLQIKTEFINGLRKTSLEVMNVAEMVLSGAMANKLVRELQNHDISAIGISGSDGSLLQAKAKDFHNLGYVGEITDVNEQFLFNLLSLGMIPVISPLAVGVDGPEIYNVNADTVAAAVAKAVKAKKLLFVTDVPGVLNGNTLLNNTSVAEINVLIEEGIITGGMIPKVEACIHSLEAGVEEAMIVSGHSHLFNGQQITGTLIQKEMEAVN